MEKEYSTTGWDAITTAFETLYPDQKDPLHYGTLLKWRFGGNSPLDGVSIYDGGDFYHFVTFGFTELYEKENPEEAEYSGYGFELTLKLKKDPSLDPDAEEEELRTMVGVLQSLGRYVFEQNVLLQPNEYFYTGQTAGMDAQQNSKITGFILKQDELGIIDTPNGKVEFVELIGMTDRELKTLVDKQATRAQVEDFIKQYQIDSMLTDYHRDDLF